MLNNRYNDFSSGLKLSCLLTVALLHRYLSTAHFLCQKDGYLLKGKIKGGVWDVGGF